MERDEPAPVLLATTVRRGVLVAGNAENLTVGQGVGTTQINGHLVVCLPTAGSIVVTTGVPVERLAASPGAVSTVAPTAFASSARALPGCEDGCIGKSHIQYPFSNGN